ncbi:MAG: hypothetical protein ACI96M_003896 [Candidatus Azotimanducaceae bacterium]|jgi:hypothetical protein
MNILRARLMTPEHPVYHDLFAKLDTKHPHYENRNWRDVHHIWQWMITNAELEAVMKELGYRKPYFADFGAFGDLKTL